MGTRFARRISVITASLLLAMGVAVAAAPSALAAISFGVTVSIPTPVAVGQSGVGAAIVIQNTSNFLDAAGNRTLTSITLDPSCGATSGGACSQPESGVFALSPTATGRPGTQCSGATFTISAPNAGGTVTFAPNVPVTLGPNGAGHDICAIDFTLSVLRVPNVDFASGTAGIQTASVANVTGSGTTSHGTATTTITVPPYVALTPARIVDTRAGELPSDGFNSPIAANASIDIPVLGKGGVPTASVGAVAINVTSVNGAGVGFLTLWPTGQTRPNASSVNYTGPAVANLVVVPVGTGGKVSVFAGDKATDVILDVQGWLPVNAGYNPLTPARILDTRPGHLDSDGFNSSLGPNGSIDVPVLGQGGVPLPPPATNGKAVDSVLLTVTAVTPTIGGFLTVWPTGQTRPTASNVNFAAQQNAPNLVLAKIGANGKVSVFNAFGNTHVIFDVEGWFPPTGGAATLPTPKRILDTRPGELDSDGFNTKVGPGETIDVPVLNKGGVPAAGVGAVIINVTVAKPSGGFVTIFPTGATRPDTSNLNFGPDQTVANLVFAKVGAGGKVSVYNATGSSDVIFDVQGWFPA